MSELRDKILSKLKKGIIPGLNEKSPKNGDVSEIENKEMKTSSSVEKIKR